MRLYISMPRISTLPDVKWSEDTVLILIRGIPGTRKTTLRKRLQERYGSNCHGYEADMFFETPKGYVYNPKLIHQAHKWCQDKTAWSLRNGFNPVIVANTFVQNWQMIPYFNMCREYGAKLKIIELFTEYGSIHGVPESTMQKMRDNWEPVREERLIGIDYSIMSERIGGTNEQIGL